MTEDKQQPPPDRLIDAWLRAALAQRLDATLHERIPEELLRLLRN